MPYSILGDVQTLTLSNDVECENPCCILTLNCEVLLMGNMTVTNYKANTALATLPESMRPNDIVIRPCAINYAYDATTKVILYSLYELTTDLQSINIIPLQINNSGEISLNMDIPSGIVYTNGLSFNVADKYYNSEIGNNFSQGTAPLRWNGDVY